ncbi:MAG: hypothetical protein GC160_24900 [Acidobacteria bacterium]|nr:hypothetical protein [Acidobacteriota bacterium]
MHRLPFYTHTFVLRIGLVLLAANFLWGQAGPPGGSVNDLLIYDAQKVWAATDAGVFESSDGGQTWRPRSEGLPASPVTSITGRPAQLFVSLDGAGVWRSRNGEAWVEINDGVGDPAALEIENAPDNPEVLFVATRNNGVLYSNNSGDGWIRAGSGLVIGPYVDIAFTPGSPQHMYAVNSNGGLFESTDGGQNWTLPVAVNVSFRRVRFNPHAPNEVWLATGSGLLRRTAAGQQFQAIAPLNGVSILDFLVDADDPNLFYAATRDSGLIRSLDGGTNWELAGLDLPVSFMLTMERLPSAPPTLLAGLSGTGVFRSADQGVSWSQTSQGMTGANVLALAADPTQAGVVYAAVEGGGLYKTSTAGDSWVESRTGFELNRASSIAVDPAEPTVLYAGSVNPLNTSSGLIARSLDGGANWETTLSGRPIYSIAVHPTDKATVYFASDGGSAFNPFSGLFQTRDRGLSFSEVIDINAFTYGVAVRTVAVDPTNPRNIYAGTNGLFLTSADEAGRFSALQTPPVGSIAVDPNDSRRVFFGTVASTAGNGLIARSTDTGKTFTTQTSGLPDADLLSFSSLVIDKRDGAIYAAGANAVYKSVDGGDSWQEANSGLENVTVRRLAVDGVTAGTVYAATVDAGVYRTTDSGATWTPTGTAALTITAEGVVGAADFLGGGVAPGEIISIFGDGIGPGTGVQATLDSQTGGLPLSLAGVRVLFNGEPAPLFYVSATQINCQAPYEIAGKSVARVQVEFGDGRTQEALIPVRTSKPGIFRAVLNQNGSVNTADNPAKAGDVVVIFATGQGVTNPPAVTGQPGPGAEPFPRPTLPVKVTIDGREAVQFYAGAAPGFVGLMQVNLRIPQATASGARTVELTVGDESGSQSALLYVAP